MGLFDSLKVSRKYSKEVFSFIVLLDLASVVIFVLGLLCFGIGIVIALPVVMLTWAAAFDQIFGVKDSLDGNPDSCIC
jgi:uncharacterized membrane protein